MSRLIWLDIKGALERNCRSLSGLTQTRRNLPTSRFGFAMSFFTNFGRDREVLQNDGVYIGGWTMKNVLKPVYKDNKNGMQKAIFAV